MKNFMTNNKTRLKLFLALIAVVLALTVATGVFVRFFFGRSGGEGELDKLIADRLTIGECFTVDDVVDAMDYEPLWIGTDAINVTIYTHRVSGEEENCEEGSELLSYDAATRSFSVVGVGRGEIAITSKVDNTVGITLRYKTHFASPDTLSILEQNYPGMLNDDIVTGEEMASVTSITIADANKKDLSDFRVCSTLKSVIITSVNDVVNIEGKELLPQAAHFLVNEDKYYEYLEAPLWVGYEERLFPKTGTPDHDDGAHTVVLELNGGRMEGYAGDSVFTNYDHGEKFKKNQYDPRRDGYTFVGWFTKYDKDNRWTADHVVNDDVKLYAVWTANNYSVVYADEAENTLPSQAAHYDETFSIITEVPSKSGYTFMGWSTSENATKVEYQSGERVSNLTTQPQGVVTLYPVFTSNEYVIIYHPGMGVEGVAVPNRISASYDVEVDLSDAEPVREGYAFIGWTTIPNSATAEFNAGDKVKNLVSDSNGIVYLYAVWQAHNYKISYDANGGTNAPSSHTAFYGTATYLSSVIPSRTYYTFLGWSANPNSTIPEYYAGATVNNLVSDPNGDVKLYAVWTLASFEISYDPNGGDTFDKRGIAIYNTSYVIISNTPTRTGYTFAGWSTSNDNSVEFATGDVLTYDTVNRLWPGNAGGEAKLYACWTVNYYKVTIKQSGATITGVTDGEYYAYGTKLTVYIKYSKDNSKSFKLNGEPITSGYTFSMPAEDVLLEGYSECVATGSLITLADGTQKRVEELTRDELLLAWDFKTGRFVAAPIAIIYYHGDYLYDVTTLEFSDGTSVEIIGSHGFFDYELNDFVYIDDTNYGGYIGHSFAKTTYVDGEAVYEFVKLENAYVTEKLTGAYSVQTAFYDNFMVGNMFSLTPPTYPGFFGYFEMGDNMQYDQEKMQADIEKYGVYTYEEWSEYLTYEQFMAFNGPYLKVAVEKGLITREQIINLIKMNLGGGNGN